MYNTNNNTNNKNNKKILILIIVITIIIKKIILLILILIKRTYYRLSSFYTQSYWSKCRKRNYLFGTTLSTSKVNDTKLNKN